MPPPRIPTPSPFTKLAPGDPSKPNSCSTKTVAAGADCSEPAGIIGVIYTKPEPNNPDPIPPTPYLTYPTYPPTPPTPPTHLPHLPTLLLIPPSNRTMTTTPLVAPAKSQRYLPSMRLSQSCVISGIVSPLVLRPLSSPGLPPSVW